MNNELEAELESIRSRKPARTMIEVPGNVKQALSSGWVATKNLTEWHATDRQKLLETVCLQLNFDSTEIWTGELLKYSALKQSIAIGQWLSYRIKVGDENWQFLAGHASDVVREWAAIVVGQMKDTTFARKLAWIKQFAEDSHSGLREIAWLTLRSDVILSPENAIKSLVPWTGSRSERLRRFAAEITRPCGVWCSHFSMLKERPEMGLPILEPLRSDASMYVKNSVGNWLNDASKSQPQWVQVIAASWLDDSPTVDTKYIVKRALRTIGKG